MSKWMHKRFGEVVTFATGQVDPKNEPYSEYLHIGPENVESGTGRILSPEKAKDLGLISGKYLFDEHAIVYSKIRPNLNKVCMPNFVGLCSADMYPIWPKEEILEKTYLFYFMKSPMFVEPAVKTSMRTGLPKINRDDLSRLIVSFPEDIVEQRAIANVLGVWDAAIEKAERLIAAKEKGKKHSIYQLVFGKTRLAGCKTIGLLSKPWFVVPNDWQMVKIGSIAEEVSTKNQDGDNLPVLSCTKYQGLVDSLMYFDKQIFSMDTSAYKVVKRGQFAYATNHIEEGSIGYQNLYPRGLVSPMYTVFKTNEELVNDGFLYKLLKTETYRHIFQVKTSASVDRRGSLRWQEFSQLPIPLPTLNEQVKINSAVELLQKEIDLLRQKLELMKKQKRGLMQKLLTGESWDKTAKEGL